MADLTDDALHEIAGSLRMVTWNETLDLIAEVRRHRQAASVGGSDAELVKALREDAQTASAASKWLADVKTARNNAAEGLPPESPGYTWTPPEHTKSWRAADRIESLSARVAELDHECQLSMATIAEERARVAELEAAIALQMVDAPTADDDAIRAAHPTNTGRHDIYMRALELVGARHGKYALVNCINWLLARADKAEAELARRDKLAREGMETTETERAAFKDQPMLVWFPKLLRDFARLSARVATANDEALEKAAKIAEAAATKADKSAVWWDARGKRRGDMVEECDSAARESRREAVSLREVATAIHALKEAKP